jgi:hypothetical protein
LAGAGTTGVGAAEEEAATGAAEEEAAPGAMAAEAAAAALAIDRISGARNPGRARSRHRIREIR